MALNINQLMRNVGAQGNQFMDQARNIGSQAQSAGYQAYDSARQGMSDLYGNIRQREEGLDSFLQNPSGGQGFGGNPTQSLSPNEYARLMMMQQPQGQQGMMRNQQTQIPFRSRGSQQTGANQRGRGFMGAMGDFLSDPNLYSTLGSAGLRAYESGGDMSQMMKDPVVMEQLLSLMQSQAGQAGFGRTADVMGAGSQLAGMMGNQQSPSRSMFFREGLQSLPKLAMAYSMQQQRNRMTPQQEQDEGVPPARKSKPTSADLFIESKRKRKQRQRAKERR